MLGKYFIKDKMEAPNYLECICKDPNHAVRISETQYPDEPPSIVLDLHLNHFLKFRHRLKLGIKFIFGISLVKDTGHFDTVILSDSNIDKLHDIVCRAKVRSATYNDNIGKDQ